MKARPSTYYEDAFKAWVSSADAQTLVSAIVDAAPLADMLCRKNFRNSYENSSWAKGSIRKQFIEEHLRTLTFEGDIVAQPRDCSGRFTEDDEGCNNFTLLRSRELAVAAMVWHSRPYKRLPHNSALSRYLAAPPESPQQPLFPNFLHKDHLPIELDAFFVIRFELDEGDPSGATIGKIDVVIPVDDCKNIYCYACPDLRTYSATVIQEAEVDLQVELLEQIDKVTPPAGLPPLEVRSEIDDERLDIEIRPDDVNGE